MKVRGGGQSDGESVKWELKPKNQPAGLQSLHSHPDLGAG